MINIWQDGNPIVLDLIIMKTVIMKTVIKTAANSVIYGKVILCDI